MPHAGLGSAETPRLDHGVPPSSLWQRRAQDSVHGVQRLLPIGAMGCDTEITHSKCQDILKRRMRCGVMQPLGLADSDQRMDVWKRDARHFGMPVVGDDPLCRVSWVFEPVEVLRGANRPAPWPRWIGDLFRATEELDAQSKPGLSTGIPKLYQVPAGEGEPKDLALPRDLATDEEDVAGIGVQRPMQDVGVPLECLTGRACGEDERRSLHC